MRYFTISLRIALAVIVVGLSHAAYSSPLTAADDACGLLDQASILKVTGLKVGDGVAGKPIPGVLGRCTWTAGTNRVIVTLGDAQHMQLTVTVQEQSGGTSVPGVGTRAVAAKGAAFTGGGYIISVLDAKGGFGVSVLGSAGTLERVVALAKIVESRR